MTETFGTKVKNVENDPLLSQLDGESHLHVSDRHHVSNIKGTVSLPTWAFILVIFLSSLVATIVTLAIPHTFKTYSMSRLVPGLDVPPCKLILGAAEVPVLTYTSGKCPMGIGS